MTKTFSKSRRTFLQGSVMTPLLAPLARAGQGPAPADAICTAVIGIGGQGTGDINAALQVPGVRMVAAADVYDGRLARAREVFGSELFTTRDYREVLARGDVDAVIIATPDHWHAQISVDALGAGKHVYCEKPMVWTVQEGHKVIAAQKKAGRVLQVGSQRVSSPLYAKARDLLASGAIGQLNLVESWIDRNSAIGAWQYTIPADASPATIDWDRFLGSAPRRAFEPIRLFRWRNYRDYGTGIPGDLFVHLFSGLHFITGSSGPSRIQATGGLRYWKDGRDVPDVMAGLYDYPGFNVSLKVNFAAGAESSGYRFVGSEGVMTIDAGITVARSPRAPEPGYTIGTFPRAAQEAFLQEYRQKYPEQKIRSEQQERYTIPRAVNDSVEHFRVFFDAIRQGKSVVEDAAFGLRAAAPALLSNDAYFEQKIINWDPEAMVRR